MVIAMTMMRKIDILSIHLSSLSNSLYVSPLSLTLSHPCPSFCLYSCHTPSHHQRYSLAKRRFLHLNLNHSVKATYSLRHWTSHVMSAFIQHFFFSIIWHYFPSHPIFLQIPLPHRFNGWNVFIYISVFDQSKLSSQLSSYTSIMALI